MKIVVVIPMDEAHRASLARRAPDEELLFVPRDEVTEAVLRDADALIGNVLPALTARAPKLRWMQLNSAGTDGYTAPGALPEGACLTNASGAYGLAISEHMLGALLCLMKNLHLYGADQPRRLWRDHGPVSSIWHSRALVVGLGDIGGEFAMRMNALGSRVTGIRRTRAEKPDYLEALYQMDRLNECLAEADVVASCLPGTKDTRHVFDGAAFARMKPGAYFLNVGRGSAVDAMALAEALNSGHLAGASVDVTEPEPLPPDHPLWAARNILITPHVSGGLHLQETYERIVRIAEDNLARFVKGEPLRNVVDFETGYRKAGQS